VGASFDLRIYVAVTSPYPWNRGVTDMTHDLIKAHDSEKELLFLNFVKTDDLIDNEYPRRK